MLGDEKAEILEELEQGNDEEDLLEKRKKTKNKNLKLMNSKFITLLIINIFIIPIIYFIYIFFDKTSKKIQLEMSNKSIGKNNLNQIDLKLQHTIVNPKGESEVFEK